MPSSTAILGRLLPVIGIALGAPAAVAQHYVFTTLDVPGQTITQTTGTPDSLNDSDQVVGSTFNRQTSQFQGFIWTAGNFALYPTCDVLAAINDKGLAAGYPSGAGAGYCTVDARTGTVLSYPVHARGNLRLQGINAAGAALGQVENTKAITSGVVLNRRKTTVLQAPGSVNKYGGTFASDINDQGTVVGYYSDAAAVVHGFMESAGAYTSFDVPGGTGTYPYFIEKSGAVGGGYLTHGSGGTTVAFVLIDGTYTIVSPPGSIGGYAEGIGPGGEIVGSFIDSAENTHGFVDRGGVFYQIDVPGASYTAVEGVNTLGSLVGNYRDQQNNTHAFIAQCPTGQSCTE